MTRARKCFAVLFAVSIGAATAVVSTAGAAVGPNWPMIFQNLQRTASTTLDGPTDPVQLWRFDQSAGNPAAGTNTLGGVHAPVVVDGTVYIVTDADLGSATGGAGVLALDAATGAIKWQLPTGTSTDFTEDAKGAPAVGPDGTVYVAFSNCLVGLNGATGAVLWKVPQWSGVATSDCGMPARGETEPKFDGFSEGPTVGADGTIYVPTGDGFLVALNPPSGVNPPTLKWSFQTAPTFEKALCDRDLHSTPAIATDGSVYVGGDDPEGRIWKLKPSDGTVLASAMIDSGITSCNTETRHDTNTTPAIDEARGSVYIGSDDGMIHAYSLDLATHKWAATAGTQSASNADTGPEDSHPAVNPSDGTIVVGSGDGNVYAINPDGTAKWNHSFCGTTVAVESGPAITANGLAITGTGCGLVAYRIADGTIAWSWTTDDVEFAPAIGPDGTVYFPSDRTPGSEVEPAVLTALIQRPLPPTTTTTTTTTAPTTTTTAPPQGAVAAEAVVAAPRLTG